MNSESFEFTWEQAVQYLKDQPDQAELVKAAFYDDPLKQAAERYWYSSEWAAVREILPNTQGKVLEVGAGRGIASYAFAKDGWQVTALEPDQSDLVGVGAIRSLSKDAGINVNIVDTWGEDLPFDDESFDVVFCRAVLHHARDLPQLCKQVGRVLKPGGMFVAIREHVISSKKDLPAFFELHPLHHLYGGENAFLLPEYCDAIKSAGFRLSQVMNPFSSDINLYPQTISEVRKRIATKLHLHQVFVPTILLRMRGFFDNTPGRLYSFVAIK